MDAYQKILTPYKVSSSKRTLYPAGYFEAGKMITSSSSSEILTLVYGLCKFSLVYKHIRKTSP